MSLSFSPVKLVLLIGWVYLCLFLVQRTEFNPRVPKERKGIANLVTLITGPLLPLVLVIRDGMKKSSAQGGSFVATVTENIRYAFSHVGTALHVSKEDSKISLLDSSGRGIREIYGHDKSKQEDRHVLVMTEKIILEAIEERASDILIDPQNDSTHTVRLRIDGMLHSVRQVDSDMGQAVINSIKAVSNMDISERRRPQDGAFTAKIKDGTIAFRVAGAGVISGEKLSIRVLNQNARTLSLSNVGLPKKQQKIITDFIAKPSGMLLMCGPTGSGKTTTVYAMLNEIDFYSRNVITVEDPIECLLPNCSQIEVNPKADITFAKSLRSILRQDPDVICIGEIRDEETAGIALRASQTGHLVLATIHSDTNASALVRLLDLGVSPLLLSSGLNLVISQRLVRRLCDNCKVPANLSPSDITSFKKRGIEYRHMYQAQGCRKCNNTGYYGRNGVFDILVLDDKLKSSIASNILSIATLKADGEKRGKSNLYKEGLRLVVSGETDLEELKRVVG